MSRFPVSESLTSSQYLESLTCERHAVLLRDHSLLSLGFDFGLSALVRKQQHPAGNSAIRLGSFGLACLRDQLM